MKYKDKKLIEWYFALIMGAENAKSLWMHRRKSFRSKLLASSPHSTPLYDIYSFFSVRARSSPAERMEIASPCLNDATAKFNVQQQTTTQMKKIAAFLTSTMNTTNTLIQNLKPTSKFQSMFMCLSRTFLELMNWT